MICHMYYIIARKHTGGQCSWTLAGVYLQDWASKQAGKRQMWARKAEGGGEGRTDIVVLQSLAQHGLDESPVDSRRQGTDGERVSHQARLVAASGTNCVRHQTTPNAGWHTFKTGSRGFI